MGLYAFVETDLDEAALRGMAREPKPDLIHVVEVLPRDAKGEPRLDVLQLIAANRLDELEVLIAREPGLGALIEPIVAARLNLTDRVFK